MSMTIVLDRLNYPGLVGSVCQEFVLDEVVKVSKWDSDSCYQIRLLTKTGYTIEIGFNKAISHAQDYRNKACDAIVKMLEQRDEQSYACDGKPTFIGRQFSSNTPLSLSPSLFPKPMNTDSNSGALSTILSDAKSFVRENRNVIYTVVTVILIDKFVLEGRFTERIRSLVDRLLGRVEKKVDAVGAVESTKN